MQPVKEDSDDREDASAGSTPKNQSFAARLELNPPKRSDENTNEETAGLSLEE
jgi:hypothetical protein